MKGVVLHGVDNFARVWLRPTAALLRSAPSEMEKALAASTFLECYGWLEAYVQADICPSAARTKLLQRFFDGIQISYELLQNLAIWPQHVIETAQQLRESASNQGRPKLDKPSAFRTLVQLSAQMAAELAFSAAGQAFASLIFFSKPPRWQSFIASPPHPGPLAQALSGRSDPWLDGNRELAYAGLVRTVEHTKGLSYLIEQSHQHHFAQDSVIFRETVVAAHGWRLQPRLEAQERYNAIVASVDGVIAQGLEGHIQTSPGFADEAKASLRRWRMLTGPKEIAAGGG